jgi:hypothetical protein
MQKLVNDIITPIAAQLAQQKQSQLARLGCTVEGAGGAGAPPAADAHHSSSVGVGNGVGGSTSSSSRPGKRRGAEGRSSKRSSSASSSSAAAAAAAPAAAPAPAQQPDGGAAAGALVDAGAQALVPEPGAADAKAPKISHKRFESVILKSHPLDLDPFGVPPDMDLDWGDFFFNLVGWHKWWLA